MRLTSNHSFEIPGYGRSITDDNWETVEPLHIAVWETAVSSLKSHRIRFGDHTVDLDCNWSPILAKHQQHYGVMQRLGECMKEGRDPSDILDQFPRYPAVVPIVAEIVDDPTAPKNDSHMNLARSAIASHLHDCFLILNICAPASCEFYRAELSDDRASEKVEVSLSNILFETALLSSSRSNWPPIKAIPLQEVMSWFYSVREGVSQLPQNPMEKTLFALLHLSKSDMTPMNVIWLFYAFESLLQTKVGENFSSMHARFTALLDFNDAQSKLLKTELRSLYNIRSAIVHGGFEVSHPMHNEILDPRVDDNFERLLDATDYAHTLLISGIQRIIERGWKYPHFKEQLAGVPIEST